MNRDHSAHPLYLKTLLGSKLFQKPSRLQSVSPSPLNLKAPPHPATLGHVLPEVHDGSVQAMGYEAGMPTQAEISSLWSILNEIGSSGSQDPKRAWGVQKWRVPCKDSVVCTLAYTPKPRFRFGLPW